MSEAFPNFDVIFFEWDQTSQLQCFQLYSQTPYNLCALRGSPHNVYVDRLQPVTDVDLVTFQVTDNISIEFQIQIISIALAQRWIVWS